MQSCMATGRCRKSALPYDAKCCPAGSSSRSPITGRGFRPDHIRNPLKEENLYRENGRGIFLMRTLMDKVEFEHLPEGMQVRLWLNTNK